MLKTLEATKFVNVQLRLDPDLKVFINRFARIHDLDVSKLTRLLYRRLQQLQYEDLPGQADILRKVGWVTDGVDGWLKARHNSLLNRQ